MKCNYTGQNPNYFYILKIGYCKLSELLIVIIRPRPIERFTIDNYRQN